MSTASSGDLLSLVQRALDEIDDRPLDVTVRRAARIASMLGETELAVYLGLELKGFGGAPSANAEDTRRMMADPTSWGDPDGPAEAALKVYFANRLIDHGPDNGKIMGHSLAEMSYILKLIESSDSITADMAQDMRQYRSIRERIRHKVFAALCSWERQLTYANVNERIFERFRSHVDAVLARGVPGLLDQFSAVYRRLREASKNPAAPLSEELAQAVTTCRRILKAVADQVLPPVPGGKSETGHSLGDDAYRNRIYQFIKDNVSSDSVAGTVTTSYGGIVDRFNALDKLANKGVHAELGLREAELCAINTYLIAGELLSIHTHADATT